MLQTRGKSDRAADIREKRLVHLVHIEKHIDSRREKSAALRRSAAIIAAAVLLIFALTGCGPSDKNDKTAEAGTGITVTDHAGRTVELPADIDRIAVADILPLPSVLAVFFDSSEKIVGMSMPSMTAAQNGLLGELYPELLEAETGFINDTEVNMEELALLEPDVVFYSASDTALGDRLTDAGFAAVAISASRWDYNCIETLNNWIALLSEIFPENDKSAAVRERSEAAYRLVQDRVKDIPEKDRLSAFILFRYDAASLMTSGQQFFGQWWCDAAGMRNVAQELAADNAVPVSMEQIYEWDPDVIFMTNFNQYLPEDLYGSTLSGYDWSPVKAVRDKRVYKMPLGMYRSYTPGADCPVTLLWMAKTAYPELFEDIDIIEEAKSYYMDVFGITLTDEQAASIFAPPEAAGGGFGQAE